jgi:hypothetical protein
MKIAGRLVSQDDAGIGDDCARNAHQLLLATGELAGEKILLAYDLKSIERVTNDRLPGFLINVALRK